jgi:hypothetical protein
VAPKQLKKNEIFAFQRVKDGAICYLLLAIGYWLLAIGYWLLAIGYRLSAIGYRLFCRKALGILDYLEARYTKLRLE